MNVGQAENRGGMTSQPPEESLTPRRGQERHKGWVTGQPLKVGQVVYPRADHVGQRAAFKTELSHLAGGGTDQTELQLRGSTAVVW
jgi:hypothetical protein